MKKNYTLFCKVLKFNIIINDIFLWYMAKVYPFLVKTKYPLLNIVKINLGALCGSYIPHIPLFP